MKKIKNILKNKYVIMLLFFVIILIMHMFYNFSNDDVNYFNSILDNKNIIDFVIIIGLVELLLRVYLLLLVEIFICGEF